MTDNCNHLSLPDGPKGTTLRAFLEGQYAQNGELMKDCFTKDCVFNGCMFQKQGSTEIVELYKGFLGAFMVSFKVEAAAAAGANGEQWIVTEIVRLKGTEDTDLIVVDVLTFEEVTGKVCRLDNCFDAQKVKLPAPPAEE